MTFPRALTWLHLLPADSAYLCDSGPPWLREELAAISIADGKRTAIAWDHPAEQITLGNADAFAGINCGHIGAEAFRSAGLPHVTRFAVLPGLHEPRWFIPLGSPAVSAAAFNLYSPARLTARAKRFAAQVAVRTRLPFWYRDHVTIAQRAPSPLEAWAHGLFPGHKIAIALSSGAPEGARNRKASAAVIARTGTLLAFLKLAGSELSESLLRNEANVLKALAGRGMAGQLVPELIAAKNVDGTFVAAQSPLPGRPAGPNFTPAHQRFLHAMASSSLPVAQTALVRGLSARIAALPASQARMSAALEQMLAGLDDTSVPVGFIHGDFAPWNLRIRGGQIAAFDWEYGSPNAPLVLDEIHHRLQVGHLLRHWTIERALHECRDLGRSMLVLYLLDILARLLAEGYDSGNEMLAWLDAMLARLMASAPREASLA